MFLIVGLGNPETKYKDTPHNIGFKTIDLFKERFNFPNFEIKNNKAISKKEDVLLLKPLTYMNNSGIAVKEIKDFYKIPLENIIIIHDENDLTFSKIRISIDRGAAGHNGVISIIEKLGSKNFTRIRVGIQEENKNLLEHVLKPLSKEKIEILDEAIFDCTNIAEEIIKNGIEKTMIKYN